MSDLKLPTTNTISFSLNMDTVQNKRPVEKDSIQHSEYGSVDGSDFKELENSRNKGAEILWATICLEQKMETAISEYFFGKELPNHKRHIFEHEVLQTSSFQFSAKKHLIHVISKEQSLFSGKEISLLQGVLKKVMNWRNAFAHGSLKIDATKGIILEYYSGGHKYKTLNQDFWVEVEDVFGKGDKLVSRLIS